MSTRMNEQIQNSFRPFNELLAINIKTLNTLAECQTNFFTETLNDGLMFSRDVSEKNDMASYLKAQREFGENIQSKFMEATREAYSVITEAQNEASEVFRGAYKEAEAITTDAVKKTAAKISKDSKHIEK